MIWYWADYFCFAFVLVFGGIGIYTHDLNYIMPAVMGLWAFAGLAAMTKWVHHVSEIADKTMQHDKDMADMRRDDYE